jgi:hypothetical protein
MDTDLSIVGCWCGYKPRHHQAAGHLAFEITNPCSFTPQLFSFHQVHAHFHWIKMVITPKLHDSEGRYFTMNSLHTAYTISLRYVSHRYAFKLRKATFGTVYMSPLYISEIPQCFMLVAVLHMFITGCTSTLHVS